MRWKKKKIDAMMNTKTNKISGNMAVMTVAKEKSIIVE